MKALTVLVADLVIIGLLAAIGSTYDFSREGDVASVGYVLIEITTDPNVHAYDDDGHLTVVLEPTGRGGYDITDASIRRLAKSGRICEVLGHSWETDWRASAPNVEVADTQTCRFCGATRPCPNWTNYWWED